MAIITFLGGGNMASAIISGLIEDGTSPETISVVDPDPATRRALQDGFGVGVSDDAIAACEVGDVIVLAVKPQVIVTVAEALAGVDLTQKLLLSIAAGVTVQDLESLFGTVAIARTMPNIPATLRLGATGIVFNDRTTEEQRSQARRIVEAFGICIELPREEMLDAVTAVSGSGPAYYFLFIEEMIRAAISLGLAAEDARKLTLQTALGSISMATRGNIPVEELRRRVTSSGGTTHSAIMSLQSDNFGDVLMRAMVACRNRALELGQGGQ